MCTLSVFKDGENEENTKKVFNSIIDQYYQGKIEEVGNLLALEFVTYDAEEAAEKLNAAYTKLMTYVPNAAATTFSSPIV
jgi:hypothetical protein